MKILFEVLNKIIQTIPLVPPETGGIIGGNRNIISIFQLDSGSNNSNGYDYYTPDTKILNDIITYWQKRGIVFYGIFHSHFPGGSTLSNGDIRYIEKIMFSMPPGINQLYFPIIFPRKGMIVYRADRWNEQVHIIREKIEIL